MYRGLLFTVFLFSCLPAYADSFYTLVGFTCDQSSDRLVIHYRGAYNEDGEVMVQQKSRTEWEPGHLIASMKDGDHIGSLIDPA